MVKSSNGIPVIKKDTLTSINWDKISFTSFSNIGSIEDKNNCAVLMFQYDYTLERIWNDPAKYIGIFSNYAFIATPDFSAYANMDRILIEYNIYKSRWLGAYYQALGIHIIPTVTWALPDTFDICFDGIEPGSVVAISTIGTSNNKIEFLAGFNEMVKRIKPSLIILRGKIIEGMVGKFVVVDFKETFNNKIEQNQLHLFTLDRIITIKEVSNNGW